MEGVSPSKTISDSNTLRQIATTIAFLSCVLNACVPVHVSEYVPSGPGTIKNPSCIAGKDDTLRISALDDVQIVVRAGKHQQKGTIALYIDFILPDGVLVQLLSPSFIVYTPEPHALTVKMITVSGPLVFDATAELRAIGPLQNDFGLWFMNRPAGATSVPIVDSFSLQFPEMRINGKVYRAEPIRFESKDFWSVAFCLQ